MRRKAVKEEIKETCAERNHSGQAASALVEETMATASTERSRPEPMAEEKCAAKTNQQGEGLKQYYLQHIQDLQLQVCQSNHNLNRLEALRNDLNSRGSCLCRLLFLCIAAICLAVRNLLEKRRKIEIGSFEFCGFFYDLRGEFYVGGLTFIEFV